MTRRSESDQVIDTEQLVIKIREENASRSGQGHTICEGHVHCHEEEEVVAPVI